MLIACLSFLFGEMVCSSKLVSDRTNLTKMDAILYPYWETSSIVFLVSKNSYLSYSTDGINNYNMMHKIMPNM